MLKKLYLKVLTGNLRNIYSWLILSISEKKTLRQKLIGGKNENITLNRYSLHKRKKFN